MINELTDLVTGSQIASWLVIALLVGYFVYKEWPDLRRRISKSAVKEQKDQASNLTIEGRLDSIEGRLGAIEEKLNNDYVRLNAAETKIERFKVEHESEMEELEIIMRALLGVLGGLQELGANGPTKEAEGEIMAYMLKRTHDVS